MKKKDGTKKKKRETRHALPDAEFRELWNGSSSLDEAAEKIGRNKGVTSNQASKRRARGVDLKCFDPHMCDWIPTPLEIHTACCKIRSDKGHPAPPPFKLVYADYVSLSKESQK